MLNNKSIFVSFINYLEKEKKFSVHTIKAYRNDIENFLLFLSAKNLKIKNISKIDIRDFLASQYEKGFSKKTVARRLASIKSLFRYLRNQNKTLQIFKKQLNWFLKILNDKLSYIT